jgi:DNA polymerase
MDSAQSYWATRAMLDWQVELGADEAMGDTPTDRYGLQDEAPAILRAVAPTAPTLPAEPVGVDPVALAHAAATGASDLASLAQAQAAYDHCELKKGARSFVFADGDPAALVMIIGEAPGREEDLAGRPFVGPAGQLLDRMLAAIGLDRAATDPARAVYIANIIPWRPPSNRTPDAAEIAMMLPFVQRHIALADPAIIVLMGNAPCQALLGLAGISRIRGKWAEVLGRPALPMVHPAYLLRSPPAKREAWADLLALQSRLRSLP